MPIDVLDLVRRTAARRTSPRELAAAAGAVDADWRAAEQAIAAELGASPRRARRLVDAFARVAAAARTREARGRAARLRGSWLTFAGRFEESGAAYRRAITLLDGAARDGARIGLAAAEMRLGRFAAARNLLRAARADARRRRDTALVAAADMNEAVVLHESGRIAGAVPLYRRARATFLAAGDKRLAARATLDLANALALLDRYDEASGLYDEAAATFESLGAPFEAARCRANRGALLVATERLGEADAVLRDVESAFGGVGDPSKAALVRVDRGEAMLRAGLATEALRLLESARRGLVRGAPPVERFRASLLAARAALALGDTRTARRMVAGAQARGIAGADADRGEVLGRAAAVEGHPERAAALLRRAAEEFGVHRPGARTRALTAAAWCALEAGDVRGARRLVASAVRGAARLGVPSLEFGAAAVAFLAERRAGRRGAADRALRRAVAALERVRAGLGPDAMRAALLAGREAWFAQAVRHEMEGPGGAEAALALVERFRARALVDLVGLSDASAPSDERVAALRGRLARLERAAESAPVPGFLRGRTQCPPRRAVRAAERALADAWAARPGAPHLDAADLRAVRASLPEGTLVVALFDDGDDALTFTADRDGVRAVVLRGGAARVGALVEDLRYTLGKYALGGDYAQRHAARLADEVGARLAELARVALGPVEDEIARARRIVVVPRAPWHLVPFAALPFRGRPLVEHAPVVLAPAVGALAWDVPDADGAPLVVAAADAAAPSIDAEARAVADVLRDARVLTGDAACLEGVAAAPSPRCVHVAAHGRFRPDAPALGGVRLADGWLRAIDFATLRLRGALVVLSGCETGLARTGPGDEVHGLVRGVFASGAAELLAALWRVGDEATGRLMADFHARRAAGASSEEALAAVQREAVARGESVWAWAGFVLWTRRARPV